jgi:membrane protein DedA with SNARE-associated domain
MEPITNLEALTPWLEQYGSFALFILLALGIIAFPVPEETLLVISGILMKNGSLNITETIIACLAGSLCGITASYILGWKAGIYFFNRIGKWFGLTKEHLDKAHNWFERFGKWALFIGYFIPGVRHFTGFSAGMSRLEFKEFTLFAYCGAFFWVSTIHSIGYFFGDYGLSLFHQIEKGDQTTIAVIVLLVLAYLAYSFTKKRRSQKLN